MRIGQVGRQVFALTMIGIGLWGLVTGGFAGVWEPVPASWPGRETLAHVCAILSLLTGAGLLWRRTSAVAAGLLLVALLVWMAAIKAPPVVAAPSSAVAWESWGETAVLVAAAWTLFAEAAWGSVLGPISGEPDLRIARTIYGLALIAFGMAHFAYPAQTAALVPKLLPAPLVWVRLTGWAYVGAGVAILAGVAAGLAATLSALQMGLFSLLVWTPVVVAGGGDASQRGELALSWALTAAGWVVSDGYRSASTGHGGGRGRRRGR